MTVEAEDPHPGDFDAELASIPDYDVQVVDLADDRELVILIGSGRHDAATCEEEP